MPRQPKTTKTTPLPSTEPPSNPVAYSYIRFSTPEQAQGDSLRRQTELAEKWCERNNVRLDKSMTLHDLGKSAFHGQHHKDDRFALGAFIKLCEDGRVSPDSYLLIERLDRLTREQVEDALVLFLRLKKLVRIVQLSPAEVIYDRKASNPTQLIIAIVELMRGHDESQAKSERVGKAWAEKKRLARDGKILSRKVPAWIEERDGKLQLIPERAAVVKRIFSLSASGYGYVSIAKRLMADKVSAFGTPFIGPGKKRSAFSGKWSTTYIARIINDRRATGTYQPSIGKDRKPDGEPILDYYPAVVTQDEYDAAQRRPAATGERKTRIGKHVNIFAGLVKNARDNSTYHLTFKPHAILSAYEAREGRSPMYSFPFALFEKAILSRLREIDPSEILEGDDKPDELLPLTAELARVENELADASVFMESNGFSVTIGKRVAELESRKGVLNKRLSEARQLAAHPLSEAWEEAKSLAGLLDEAANPTDFRIRLRSAIRRVVESIHVLVVPRGRDRLAEVQLTFTGGERYRKYLIIHRPAKSNGKARVEGGWAVRSILHPDDGLPFSRDDLRNADDVAGTLGFLENYPKDAIDRLLTK